MSATATRAPAATPPRSRGRTPDAHDFPTRPYDLVREFVIALVVVAALTAALAAVFSSPDEKAITLRDWARVAPNDVVATATAELAGTSTSAGYGPPYNHASDGPKLGPLPLAKWGGVRIPVDPAEQLVVVPLAARSADPAVQAAVKAWRAASPDRQNTWATQYADALAKAPDGAPDRVAAGDYGPVPRLASGLLQLARSGGLDGALDSSGAFYGADQTRGLLLLADGAYLEDQARARNLGGDQWGMMNETGNYPGQPWMWLYTFWYQVEPFKSSGNADALVWGLMMLLSLLLVLVPFIPGLRSVPRWIPVHRLIWRSYYRTVEGQRPRR
ncbi:MAG: hypothetical protein ACTHMS_18440 [Jatrophihabitans sp.]|uniref:hypothetical protein n=1 Tax=Jatrophihabitans sp. TaxID=1932789 RepID=UPI003F803C4B